jgi:hypothetical protein
MDSLLTEGLLQHAGLTEEVSEFGGGISGIVPRQCGGGETVSEPSRWLVLVLRATAVLLLLAFVGAVLPESWMKAVYEWGELGTWPGGALLVYLARVVSLLYGFLGLVTLYLSFDVGRYQPLIRFMAIVSFAFAPVMFGVIWAAGLPMVWAVSEPASIVVISGLWYIASRPAGLGDSCRTKHRT